jgi:hypothetical protein
MREKITVEARRYAQLTFMAGVTAVLLASVFHQTDAGISGIPGMVVYALGAGFGLEYVTAIWLRRDAVMLEQQ